MNKTDSLGLLNTSSEPVPYAVVCAGRVAINALQPERIRSVSSEI